MEISDLGLAEFGDLEVGLYLVVQTTAAENYNVVNPFLVSVPIQENGKYVYDVDALPKVGTATKKTPDTPDEKVQSSSYPLIQEPRSSVVHAAVTPHILLRDKKRFIFIQLYLS